MADSSLMRASRVLKISIFLLGLAGIVTEYVLSTLASYLLGDTIFQWTLVISLMLFAMGLGSRLTKDIPDPLTLDAFVLVEIAISLACIVAVPLAYASAPYPQRTPWVIYSFALAIGGLIGMEIPLVVRANELYESLKVNISSVLEKDYLGALIGGLLYAYVGLPRLGLIYTPLVVAGFNLIAAYMVVIFLRERLTYGRVIIGLVLFASGLFALIGILSKPFVIHAEQKRFRDPIIYRKQSMYNHIVLTRWRDYYLFYLNGSLQFSSLDEARYHETLVHPPMLLADSRERVLIIGGGDGLGAREVLKYQDVKEVTVVDIDPAVTTLASSHPIFLKLNRGALTSPRTRVINEDGFSFLMRTKSLFDVIIVDLVDPKTPSAARLYSLEFYRRCLERLGEGGMLMTQATSPFFSPQSFLCIYRTMREAGFSVLPLHVNVPSMGEWGFVMGKKSVQKRAELLDTLRQGLRMMPNTRFLNREAIEALFAFGKGLFEDLEGVEINRELSPVILYYYRNKLWEVY